MLRGAGVEINSVHDVLIQHISIRVGDSPSGPDADDRDNVKIVGSTHHVVIDHVSLYWGTDETASVWAFSPETRDIRRDF